VRTRKKTDRLAFFAYYSGGKEGRIIKGGKSARDESSDLIAITFTGRKPHLSRRDLNKLGREGEKDERNEGS